MVSENNENQKPKIVLLSSVWISVIGLIIIVFDGIIPSITNPARNFQESLFIGLTGLLAIVVGYGYWREKNGVTVVSASAAVIIGTVLFINGLHSMLYILSSLTTSILMGYHFAQVREASNQAK
jgi:hypothetical protein